VQLMQHQFLANELAGLEYIRGAGQTGDRVDHRANGTKDVADAVCGVTSFLLKRRIAWHQQLQGIRLGKLPENEGMDALTENQVTTAIRRTTARKSVFRRPVARR